MPTGGRITTSDFAMTTMTHAGYTAIIEYDEDEELFHGEVLNLRDVITFEGLSVADLKSAFTSSIEEYLEFCKERREEPARP
jgi:predicted HicB family RNase H-like nuclease